MYVYDAHDQLDRDLKLLHGHGLVRKDHAELADDDQVRALKLNLKPHVELDLRPNAAIRLPGKFLAEDSKTIPSKLIHAFRTSLIKYY